MEEQEREEWFSELDLRLRARLSELARRSGVMDQVGRPELTTELVVDVRRGKEGVGVYQAMKRKLQKSADRDASDWLWWTVAALQHEGVVTAIALLLKSRPRAQIYFQSERGILRSSVVMAQLARSNKTTKTTCLITSLANHNLL